MTMHCPHCRQANAATTRFCTGCGAVLVESVRGVGRRRVLRPWGLRVTAPNTESPAMPELAGALHAARRAGRLRMRKAGVVLAGGIAVTAVAGTLVLPYAADRTERFDPPIVMVETALLPPPIKAEVDKLLTAPPLVETPALRAVKAPGIARPAQPKIEEPAAISLPEPAAQVVVAEAPATALVVAVAPAPSDRFDALRATLAACGTRGLFDRAVCEQQARLEHCAADWGTTPLCPSGRYEHTQ